MITSDSLRTRINKDCDEMEHFCKYEVHKAEERFDELNEYFWRQGLMLQKEVIDDTESP